MEVSYRRPEPREGTKANVRYWIRETREELRELERVLANDGDVRQAATEVAGVAGNCENAAEQYAMEHGR